MDASEAGASKVKKLKLTFKNLIRITVYELKAILDASSDEDENFDSEDELGNTTNMDDDNQISKLLFFISIFVYII